MIERSPIMRAPTDTANIRRAVSQNQRKIFTKSRCTGTRERKRTTLDRSFTGANASAGRPSLRVRQPAEPLSRHTGSRHTGVSVGGATLDLRVFRWCVLLWFAHVEAGIAHGIFQKF